jgi:hypothetical protein
MLGLFYRELKCEGEAKPSKVVALFYALCSALNEVPPISIWKCSDGVFANACLITEVACTLSVHVH